MATQFVHFAFAYVVYRNLIMVFMIKQCI